MTQSPPGVAVPDEGERNVLIIPFSMAFRRDKPALLRELNRVVENRFGPDAEITDASLVEPTDAGIHTELFRERKMFYVRVEVAS